MDQPLLFVDTSDDAVRDTVRALGGAKVVGPLLWPTKKPDQAERNLLDCLNANNARELSGTSRPALYSARMPRFSSNSPSAMTECSGVLRYCGLAGCSITVFISIV